MHKSVRFADVSCRTAQKYISALRHVCMSWQSWDSCKTATGRRNGLGPPKEGQSEWMEATRRLIYAMDPVVSMLYVTVAATSTLVFLASGRDKKQPYRFLAGGCGCASGSGYGSVSGVYLCICATASLTGKQKTQGKELRNIFQPVNAV